MGDVFLVRCFNFSSRRPTVFSEFRRPHTQVAQDALCGVLCEVSSPYVLAAGCSTGTGRHLGPCRWAS